MKIFIDDIRVPPNDTWHIARSVGAAIRALDQFCLEVTDIQLDHDISHQVVMGGMSRPYPCAETFESVARYIVRLKEVYPDWNPTIRLHTSNPVGAKNMAAILQDAGLESETQIAGGANRLEMQL